MKPKQALFAALLFLTISGSTSIAANPNVVLILCDDLGYGDVQCLNRSNGKIPTPHLDAFAKSGMTFTDAHSASSVCTPTRYGLLTGRYAWRTSLQHGVVTGFAPSLIDANRPTVASFLRAQGYATAAIGKWHLNFQYVDPSSQTVLKRREVTTVPVGSVIPDGPVDRGFDYFFGFHHAREMEVVVENRHVIAHQPPIDMLPQLGKRAVQYIQSRATDDRPFFLYVPLNAPHTPILPTKEWQGRSGLGPYGDFVMQTDSVIGEILQSLENNQLSANTLVIVTSDNGCSKAANVTQLAQQGHFVSGPLRGSKADLWEGGHRVPFFIRWPRVVAPDSQCDTTICLNDFFATIAELLGSPTPEGSCEDSRSFLATLHGRPLSEPRGGLVHHSLSGHFGYRLGDWKLLLARGSGGWSSPTEKQASTKLPPAQLYNLTNDLGEQENLFTTNPEMASQLLKQLSSDILQGRTTPGPAATNDVDHIELWKNGRPPFKLD